MTLIPARHITEEVTMSQRNSSIEAAHSQHTVGSSINSVGEQCTSKVFQIFAYFLAGSHLYLHWALPGITSAQPPPVLLHEIFNRKGNGFTTRRDQTHSHCVWQLESHFHQFSSLTLTRGTVSLRGKEFSDEQQTLIPLLLPIHYLWHTHSHAGICSKQILNLTKNKLLLTRWLSQRKQKHRTVEEKALCSKQQYSWWRNLSKNILAWSCWGYHPSPQDIATKLKPVSVHVRDW